MKGPHGLQAMARDEQAEFVELAASLTEQEWSAPSLCAGLSVRDVVVHIAAHIHGEPSTAEIVRLVIRSGFSRRRTDKLLDQIQRERHLWRSPADLVTWLASPIAGSAQGQLRELMIHQQDIRRAVARPRVIPTARLSEVLDLPCADQIETSSRRRVRGLRLVATDMTWTHDVGAEVAGTGEAILMAINGRADVLPELAGLGAQILTDRTTKPGLSASDANSDIARVRPEGLCRNLDLDGDLSV